jgi:hypothetical protein
LLQASKNCADPDTLICNPVRFSVLVPLSLVHERRAWRRHGLVVKRYHLPLVVEGRRSGRARLGIGGVVNYLREIDAGDSFLKQLDYLA